jgi:uncharacterized protein
MNPFKFDKIAAPSDFCGREAELERLTTLITNKANVMLYGDRRYGKTSLIQKSFELLPDSILAVYVDLYSIVDEIDFAYELYTAVEASTPNSLRKQAGRFLDLLSRVKGVDFKPSPSGDSFSMKPSIQSKNFDELLNSAVSLIEAYCEQSDCSHAVVVFDEFQQIADIKSVKIDAKLRGISQSNESVSFVFSGSKKSILTQLINAPKQPWHGMTTPISVQGIEVDVLKSYCEERLRGKFEPHAFEWLYSLFRGQTRLILHTCFYLYSEGNREPLLTDCQRIVDELIASYDDEFRDKFTMYSLRHKKALRAVSYASEGQVFSAANLERNNITKQALNQAITALEKQDELSKVSEGRYILNNILFSLWLARTE